MHTLSWLESLRAAATDSTSPLISALDLTQSYASLQHGAVIMPLADSTPLRVRGEDRLAFVHGQLSNEVRGLAVGACNRSLLLNHKGHPQALVNVFRRHDDLFLVVEDKAGEQLQTHLAQHIIFDQVTLDNLSAEIVHLSLQGSSASAILESALGYDPNTAPGHFVQTPWQNARVLITPQARSQQGGVDMYVLARDAWSLIRALHDEGALLADDALTELARVDAGIANVRNEGAGKVLPQEAGLEPYVSYRKGCYLGQEIMARLEARVLSQDKLRRHLVKLRFDTHPTDDTLRSNGKTVGRITSLVEHPEGHYLALAILNKDSQPDGATLLN